MTDEIEGPPDPVRAGGTESEAEREARYFAGYQALPESDDEELKAIARFAVDSFRRDAVWRDAP